MSPSPKPVGELARLWRLWPFARPDGWAFAYALLATPVIALTQLAQPYLIKQAIDDHITPQIMEGLTDVALLYLGAVVIGWLVEASYTLGIGWAGTRTVVRLRTALYKHCLRLPQAYFDREPAGRVLTRLTSDVSNLGDALGAGVVTIVLDLLMIVGVLTVMFALEWRLTLVMLMVAPPLLVVLELLRRRLRVLFGEIRDAAAAVNAYLAERIDGVSVVQLFNDEARTMRQFDVSNRRYRDACTTSNVYDSLMFAVVDGVSSIVVGVMIWYGAGVAGVWLGFGDGLPLATAGVMVAFIDYLDRLFRPLRDLSQKVAVLQQAGAALEKIFSLLDEPPQVAPETAAALGEQTTGHVVMRDVHFRYRPDAEDVLRGVDLEVRPGEVVAIVGTSGSGKTTLTRLLDKSYTGYRGSMTLDGVELRDLPAPWLREHVAAVRQDIQVFSDSVRFNVSMGNPELDDARLEDATGLVHADHFVRRLGWDHVLAERGADLSVGEGQLLTFARTMAHDPALVILDEATASIDTLTEALIQDAISNILSRKTVVVIAHRLSTIQNADRIAVMEHGRVVEQGTHAELLAKGGRYADLLAANVATSDAEAEAG